MQHRMQCRHNVIPYIQSKQFQQDQRENTTVGATGEISLMGENHALQRNRATKMRPTTRKDSGAEKRGADGD